MQSTIQLIDLLGAAALLLWGLRLIKTGVLRAYGGVLRHWIARGAGNRVSACFWGFVATLGLQSSTATAVIVSSFASRDLVRPRIAQAMVLGANLGTAMVAVFLSADVHWLASMAIFLGVVIFNTSKLNRGRGLGRAILGLGLMLLALRLLGEVTEPLRQSQTMLAMIQGLETAPIFAALIAAGLAILATSGLAVVILVMLLATTGAVAPPLALWLVAGANLGGAVPPWLATRSEGVAAARLTLANLIVRLIGTAVVLVAGAPLADLLGRHVTAPDSFVVAAHVAFNVGLLVIFLPLVGVIVRLAERLVPTVADTAGAPSYLDESLLPMTEMALAAATRETLRLGDMVGQMLSASHTALCEGDEAPLAEVSRLEGDVDRLHESIKLYVARLMRGGLDGRDGERANEIVAYAINLEHVGDIIEGGLAEIAAKKARRRQSLSPEGLAEISAFFQHTQENHRMAQALFLSRDEALARRLVARKVESRRLEAESADSHMNRMRSGRIETLESSAIHLDMLRDLKRVNAHLASVAYPILEGMGALEESRVRIAVSVPDRAEAGL